MPYLNYGYQKHADWKLSLPQPWDWGGYMKTITNGVDMRIDIPPTLDSMTATIEAWDFELLEPENTGDGFVDFIGFFWCDERKRTHFRDSHFPNTYRTYLNGVEIEPEFIPFQEIKYIEMNGSPDYADSGPYGFYQNTFYYMWQGNEGMHRIGYMESPVGKSYTWPLTVNDFDEKGALKDRPVWGFYTRHLDWGSAQGTPEHPCIPGDDPRHAHWSIPIEYRFSDGIWNWRYHPMCIRKNGQWYSCNRLDSEVGQGDGHLAIRKGGRWNGVWNDDFDLMQEEGFYDDKDQKAGPMVFLPRVGIGCAAVRQKEDVHEWEDFQ